MRLEVLAANEIESWPARSGIDHYYDQGQKKNSSLGTKLARNAKIVHATSFIFLL